MPIKAIVVHDGEQARQAIRRQAITNDEPRDYKPKKPGSCKLAGYYSTDFEHR